MNRLSSALMVCLAVVPAFAADPPPAPKARTLTLEVDGAPLSKVLAQITKETGYAVEDRRGAGDTPVSLKLKDAPFWQALDAVAAQADARLYLHAKDGKIALVKRAPQAPPPLVSYDGPFRTVLKKVNASRDLDAGTAGASLTVEVAWEPGLRPFLLDTFPRGLALVEQGGRRVAVPEAGAAATAVDGRTALTFDVPIPPPGRGVPKLTKVEGRLLAVVPTKMLEFDFGKLDVAAAGSVPAQKIDGVTCRVVEAKLGKDVWQVRVEAEYPPGDVKFESFQSWVVHNGLELVGAGGRRVPSTSDAQESVTARKAVLVYHFTDTDGFRRGDPKDWRLVYRTPGAIVEVPVAFAFKDVPLP